MIHLAFLLAAVLTATEYQARVVRVIDGDTVAVSVEVWPDITAQTAIRIRGIDAPEIKGKCEREMLLAREAKATLEKLLPKTTVITLRNLKPDKYAGRHDAHIIMADGRSVATVLIDAGMARPYKGGKRQGWCE